MRYVTMLGFAVALLLVACGEDDTGVASSGAAGAGAHGGSASVTTGTGATTGGNGGGGTSTGGGGAGGAGGGDGVLGCAEPGGRPCFGDLQCCSGEPYPPEGICHAECPFVSDRAMKESFQSIDRDQVLERLSTLPITEWSYRSGAADARHLGPMAQDFHAAFGLGSDDAHIHPVDAQGVTIAAVQALYERLQHLEQENDALRREQKMLESRLQQIERMR
jgi:hypothetical protein